MEACEYTYFGMWCFLFTPCQDGHFPSPPLLPLFIPFETNLTIRPVVLFKHRFIILHRSVCDQHDGLVTQASLPSLSELQMERNSSISILNIAIILIAVYLFITGQILS